jgi:hypothetical protein
MFLKNVSLTPYRIVTSEGEYLIKPGRWVDVPVVTYNRNKLIEVDADGNPKSLEPKPRITEEVVRMAAPVVEPVAPPPVVDAVEPIKEDVSVPAEESVEKPKYGRPKKL